MCQISYLLLLNKSLPNSVTRNNIHHFTVSRGQGSRRSFCESSAVRDSPRLQSQGWQWLWSAEDLTGEDTALGHSRGWWQEAFPPGLLDSEFWFPVSWLVARGLTPFLACSHGSIQYGGQLHQASKGDSKRDSMNTTRVMVICKVIQARSDQISQSVVSDSLRPHELQHARPPCPSPTPRVHSDSRPSSPWCHPAISSLVVPFSSCP